MPASSRRAPSRRSSARTASCLSRPRPARTDRRRCRCRSARSRRARRRSRPPRRWRCRRWRRISSPASAASGSLVATMPWRARTSERPCASQPWARDPGTALIAAPGCGLSADGTPNGSAIGRRASRASRSRSAAHQREPSASSVLQTIEKLARQAFKQIRQRLAVQREGAELRRPREFKASRHRRTRSPHRRVRRNHELGLNRLLEHEVQHPVLQLDFEAFAVGKRQQRVARRVSA